MTLLVSAYWQQVAAADHRVPTDRRLDDLTVGATVEKHGDVVKWITGRLGVS